MLYRNVKVFILTAAVLAGAVSAYGDAHCAPAASPYNAPAYCTAYAESAGVADWVMSKITPEAIRAYEEEIAGEPFISNLSPSDLSVAAEKLGVDIRKLKALMLLKDIAERTGEDVSLETLAAKSDFELLRMARKCGKAYYDTLSKDERETLKNKFKGFL